MCTEALLVGDRLPEDPRGRGAWALLQASTVCGPGGMTSSAGSQHSASRHSPGLSQVVSRSSGAPRLPLAEANGMTGPCPVSGQGWSPGSQPCGSRVGALSHEHQPDLQGGGSETAQLRFSQPTSTVTEPQESPWGVRVGAHTPGVRRQVPAQPAGLPSERVLSCGLDLGTGSFIYSAPPAVLVKPSEAWGLRGIYGVCYRRELAGC